MTSLNHPLLGLVVLSAFSAAHAAGRAEATKSPAPAKEWVVRSWQTEDGLPQNSVNAIVQTRDGFLWVGTSGGLAQFDGLQFRRFGLEDGLRSVRISTLAEDRLGALWIGTSGGGLSRWANGRITSFGAEEGFPTGTDVVSLAADRDGSVWVGTEKGLVHETGGTFRMIGEAQGLPRKQIRALAQDAQGALWASVILEGLYRGTNGRFVRVEKTNRAPGDTYRLLADRDGSLWAGAGNGLVWHWRDGMWQRFDPADGLPKSNIEALAQSSDGALWVGTRDSGLFRATGGRFVRATDDAELAEFHVSALAVDREGSAWAGTTAGGLFRLSPRVLEYWSAKAGLPSTTVTSAAEDASGSLWVGTADKGLHRFDGAHFTKLEDPAVSGNFPFIYCTAATSDGSVWAGGEQCLYRFQPGQPTKAFLDEPVRGEAIRALCADGDALWIGTYYSALLKANVEGVKVIAPRSTFPGGITSIVCEAGDTLWVGTSEGVHRWKRGQVKTWNTRDGLFTANVRALHRDADGTLWLGTLGGGLARFKDGHIVNITTRQGLVDDVISQIVADDFGCLWLGCNRGIMRLERRELDAFADGKISEVRPVVFGRNEGMTKEQCSGGHSPTAFKSRDGRLFFPTADGLAEIDPRRLQDLATIAPQASIQSVLLDNQPHALDSPLVVPPGDRRLTVSFTAPVLRGGERVRFRHRLEGLDKDWISASSNRVADYDGLHPGRYVFRVAAVDGKGDWHEAGASLAFTVQAFFWQTFSFQIGGALLLIASGAFAAWWRARHKHVLYLAETESTRQHQAELARVSRVSLIGELSASLAHELNQPLTAILSNAQAARRFIASGAIEPGEIETILDDIIRDDKRAGSVMHNLRAMLSKTPPVREACSLNDIVHEVATFLKGELLEQEAGLRLLPDPSMPRVLVARVEIQQVLVNLVLNADQAMRDQPREGRLIEVATQEVDGFALVSVSDRGCGIPPDRLNTIFDPFYTTKSSGLGMGLTICRRIIETHGGRIEARNHNDGGAVFSVSLPVAAADAGVA